MKLKNTSDRLDRDMLKIILGEILVSYPGFSKLKFLFKRSVNNGKKILNKEFTNDINLNLKIKSLENKLNIPEKEKEYHFSIT